MSGPCMDGPVPAVSLPVLEDVGWGTHRCVYRTPSKRMDQSRISVL